MRSFRRSSKLFCFTLLAALSSPAFAQVNGIENSRGVDSKVNYSQLTQLGPWDDRNYQITQADLALLPVNDVPVPGVVHGLAPRALATPAVMRRMNGQLMAVLCMPQL